MNTRDSLDINHLKDKLKVRPPSRSYMMRQLYLLQSTGEVQLLHLLRTKEVADLVGHFPQLVQLKVHTLLQLAH
jgi:hypothetical protein